VYGDELPVVTSAVISGRGRMRMAGVTFPARFRFSHVAGRAYRHYIELCVAGRRVVAVDERFVDGHARLELPFGVTEGPRVDQGANLALWAEAVWMPSVWVTDARVSWEPVDATSAWLWVPFGDDRERITVTFDPATGLLRRTESQRFKGATDAQRTTWITEVRRWGDVGGRLLPSHTAVTWADESSPWATLRTDDVAYNPDLDRYIAQRGP
jgi:hypothetical protein